MVERRYLVTVLGRSFEVELSDGPNGPRLRLDGSPVDLELHASAGRSLAGRIDGQAVRALVQAKAGEAVVVLHGETLAAEVRDWRLRLLEQMAAGNPTAVSGESIRAPMPGLVVGVPVSVGEAVLKGTCVAVLQAMKMENELRTVSGGTVSEVRVEVGQTVEQGQVLVVLE